MDKVQIKIIQPQTFHRCVKCFHGTVVATVCVPQFCTDEQIFTADEICLNTLSDSFAHSLFRVVNHSRVNVSVSFAYYKFQCLHKVFSGFHIPCHRHCAITENRHTYPILQGDTIVQSFHIHILLIVI